MPVTRVWRRAAPPWRVKLAAKLALAPLRLDYRLWQRLGLFRAGRMDDPHYAQRVFRAHLDRAGLVDVEGLRLLELGPGDSLFTAVLASAEGFASTTLVDAAPLARADLAPYRRLLSHLETQRREPSRLREATTLGALLAACRAEYHTRGLHSLRLLPAESIDFVFSHAVLEHVPLAEFNDTMLELRRLLRPGALASHRVDLRDHLAGRLENLRFSPQWWESPRVARAGFYTNRLRLAEMTEAFQAARFEIAWLRVERWPQLPTPREVLDPKFRSLDDDELCVRGFDVVLRAI